MKTRLFPLPSIGMTLLAGVIAIGYASAATFTWTNPSGGSWGDNGNWSSAPTFATDDVLDFSTLNITTHRTTTLDGSRTAGLLKFGDATTASHDWTVNAGSGGTLTLDTSTGTPVIEVVNRAATINAVIVGAKGLQKTGPGTLNLTGNNSYTGTTTVSSLTTTAGGTVNVSGDQSAANGGWSINGTSTVNFQSGSTIVLGSGKNIAFINGGGQNLRTLNVAGTVTSSTSGITVNGGNTVNLNSGAAWTQNGNFSIQPANTFTNATMTVNPGAAFTYAGTNTIKLSAASGTNSGSATLSLSGGTFTTGRAFDNTVAGTGSGSAKLNFSGGGTLKLSADIPSLVVTGSSPFNVATGTGGGVIDTNGFSTTLALGIADVSGQSGSLTKAGTGTLTLSGTNTYTGATAVNAGTLSVAATDQFSDTAALSLTTGATLDLNYAGTPGTADTVGNLRIDGITQPSGIWGRVGSIAALGATHESSLITGDGLINNTNSAAEYFWDGTGTAWSSAASWTYLASDPSMNPAASPDATSLAFFGADGLAADQTIQLGGNQALARLTFTSPVAFNFTGGGTNSTLTVGASGIALDATSGGATFGSADAGQKVILELGAAQAWTNLSSSPLTTVNGVSMGANTLTTAGSGSFTLGGAVTGSAGLRKTGAGNLELTGNNTFTGDKTVDRGTVGVSGDQSASTGSWILRGYSDSGSIANTAATTVIVDAGCAVAVATGKTIQIGHTAAAGGFAAQTLNANGSVSNAGILFVGRSGVLVAGGDWTQSGAATVASQGGGFASLTVAATGAFTYTSATQFLLSASGSNNTQTKLTIAGGSFTTGVKLHNGQSFLATNNTANLILSNAGTLKLAADIADLFTTAGSENVVELATGGGIVDTNGFSTTLNVAITGDGGLTKAGTGTLTTTGTNSYAGDTTVSGGALSLAGPNLADEAAVTIANGAVLNLNFSGTDTIGALTIGANPPLADGEYSNATHPTFITGSGILKVESVTSGFAAWAAGLGLSGNADDDFDKDGITDAVEYVLGTDPKASNASGIQMQKSGSDLIVTFSRSDDSETPDVALFVEAGGTLQTWPQVFEVKDITGNSSPGVEITENGTAPDTVKVIIPTGGAPGFFARLKVVVTGG